MAKLIEYLKHDLAMYWLSWRINFKAATRLRGAFVLQVVGMMVNNLGLMFAWLFLFQRFGTINGWSGLDYIGVQGINMMVFGVVILLNAGLTELPRYVDRGTFDVFLTKPAAILPQIACSAIEVATVGDIVLGGVLIGGYMAAAHTGVLAALAFLVAMLIGMVLMWCFTLLPFTLAFYMFDSDKIARALQFFFLDSGIYPTGVLTGALRTVLLTVWPGMFIGVVPLEVIRDLKWQYLLLGLIVAGVWLVVSVWLFRRSLRKYESANLVGAR